MKRAMVVDDDCAILKLSARWLESAGYEVKTAEDFDEARRQLETSRPDVLIVDVRLGYFNGIQLAVLTRVEHPDTHIVIISGWDDPVLRREGDACGAVFVCKPFTAAQLLGAIAPNEHPHPHRNTEGHPPAPRLPPGERRRRSTGLKSSIVRLDSRRKR